MTGLVALGDSLTCGEGVGVRVPLDQTWTAVLAGALGLRHRSLAAPGARVKDVLREQVPRTGSPTVTTLLVGLNDVARGGFDAAAVRQDLLLTTERLSQVSGAVLLGRLHDPVRLLWLPRRLRVVARDRVEQVNTVVDEAARMPRVHVLDLELVPALHLAGAWAVDRVHPGPAGHAALAEAAGQVLRRAGLVLQPLADAPVPPAASGPQRLAWVVGHGLPYLARNLTSLGAPVCAGLLRRP